MLRWSAQEPSRSWLFMLRRTRCSEQVEAVEHPVLLAPNIEAVASAELQSRTTSSSVLEAAVGHPAQVDRNTRAMASAWRAEQGSNASKILAKFGYLKPKNFSKNKDAIF